MATLDSLRPVASAIIEDKGKTVVYSVVTNVYNATTGLTTQTISDPQTIKVTPPVAVKNRIVDGALVKQGDAFTSIPDIDISFTPTEGDEVTFDSQTWKVIAVQRIFSGELVILWKLQLRR